MRLAGNPAVREFALKALADDEKHLAGVPVDLFVNALRDTDPRVRLQAVIGIGRLGKKEVADKLLPLLADGSVGGVLHVCNSGTCTWREYGEWALECASRSGLPGVRSGGRVRADP